MPPLSEGILFGLLLVKSLFCLGAERGKSFGVVNRHIGKHLTVKIDIGYLKTVHKTGVGDIVNAGCGVDTSDPKLTEVTLFESSAYVSVLHRLHDSLSCYSVKLGLGAEIALSPSHYLSSFLNCVYSSLDSHSLPPISAR